MNKPIFYDSDCLLCFLIIDRTDILKALFSKIILPDKVYDELMAIMNFVSFKDRLNELINEGFVEVKYIDISSNEYWRFECLKKGYWDEFKRIGGGEAAALACAIVNDGVVASNNLKDIKKYIAEEKIPLLTTSIILSMAVDKGLLSKNEANELWVILVKNNRKMPTDLFQDYYFNYYPEEYKEFFKKYI